MMDGKRLSLDLWIRAQHLLHRLRRPMTLGVRAIVVDEARRVLLVRHSYVPGWHLPGGGVEVSETALETLTRELREEGNILFEEPPVLLGIFFNGGHSRRDHVLVYVLRQFRQTGPRRRNWEIVETGFFPVADLPDETTRATRDRLAEWAGERSLSPRW